MGWMSVLFSYNGYYILFYYQKSRSNKRIIDVDELYMTLARLCMAVWIALGPGGEVTTKCANDFLSVTPRNPIVALISIRTKPA